MKKVDPMEYLDNIRSELVTLSEMRRLVMRSTDTVGRLLGEKCEYTWDQVESKRVEIERIVNAYFDVVLVQGEYILQPRRYDEIIAKVEHNGVVYDGASIIPVCGRLSCKINGQYHPVFTTNDAREPYSTDIARRVVY